MLGLYACANVMFVTKGLSVCMNNCGFADNTYRFSLSLKLQDGSGPAPCGLQICV